MGPSDEASRSNAANTSMESSPIRQIRNIRKNSDGSNGALIAYDQWTILPKSVEVRLRCRPNRLGGSAEVLKDSLAVACLLGEEASGGEHGEAAVLKLLGLHLEELGGVLGLEAEGVEAHVTGSVVGAEKSCLVDGSLRGGNESLVGADLLDGTDGADEGDPEGGGDLGEVGDGGSADLGVEEEGGSLDLLADEEANDGEHGDASVGELSLAVTLEGLGIGLLGESERIEESDGVEDSGEVVDVEGDDGTGGGDRSGGGLVASEGAEGGGGADKKGGDDELHVWSDV